MSLIGMAGLLLAAACGGEDHSPLDLMEKKQKLDRRVDRALDRIKATGDQRRRVHKLKDSLLREAMPLHKSHQALHGRLQAEWASASPDRRGLHEAVDKQLNRVKSLIHLALDRAVDLHGVLTPAQRAELTRLADQMRQMRRMWHGR